MSWKNIIKTFSSALVKRIIERIENQVKKDEKLTDEEFADQKKSFVYYASWKFIGAMKHIHSSAESIGVIRAYLLWCFHRLLSDEDTPETKIPEIPLRNPKDSLSKIMFGGDAGFAVELDTEDYLEVLNTIETSPNPKKIAFELIQQTAISLSNRGYIDPKLIEEFLK